ncbi:MAG: J domain-containing protein [Treponema sp.]|jgi:DnaJ-domain-containing protein 1|nr:J domain-containing protein [Treponema sp.]
MGIFGRLEDLIKSYLDNGDGRIFGKDSYRGGASGTGDPDLDAAFEELDGYLNRDRDAGGSSGDRERSWNGGFGGGTNRGSGAAGPGPDRNAGRTVVPETLRPDFAELGLPPGASAEECKRAYKKLLKIHHPDRHAGHPGNFKKATERTARINAAYDRIERWRETGAL